MFGYKNGAIDKSDPYKRYRYDFDTKRNRLMLQEITYISAELRMIHQPLIEPVVATQEKCCSEKQERCRRKYRKEYAQNSQTERQKADYCQ